MTHLEVKSSVPGKSKPHIDVKMIQTAQTALIVLLLYALISCILLSVQVSYIPSLFNPFSNIKPACWVCWPRDDPSCCLIWAGLWIFPRGSADEMAAGHNSSITHLLALISTITVTTWIVAQRKNPQAAAFQDCGNNTVIAWSKHMWTLLHLPFLHKTNFSM